MAIGLSWMFNVRLPFNFNSPYKSLNIVEFWRRWHITLSNFLRDYLYIPLGGNRLGRVRRHINLMVTMLLGGLWHGASWTFVVWGGLHGAYLVINHGYRALSATSAVARQRRRPQQPRLRAALIALVADDARGDRRLGLLPCHDFEGAARVHQRVWHFSARCSRRRCGSLLWNAGLRATTGFAWCLPLLAGGGTGAEQQRDRHTGAGSMSLEPSIRALIAGAAGACIVLLVLLNTARDTVSAFIYFNF